MVGMMRFRVGTDYLFVSSSAICCKFGTFIFRSNYNLYYLILLLFIFYCFCWLYICLVLFRMMRILGLQPNYIMISSAVGF